MYVADFTTNARRLGSILYWKFRQRHLHILPWCDFPLPGDVKSIAIIGNAGYLAEMRQGQLIDQHDVVLRMNNCQVGGFEEFVGARTDVYFTSFWADINAASPVIAAAKWICCSRPNNFLLDRSRGVEPNGKHITIGMLGAKRTTLYAPRLSHFMQLTAELGGYPTTGAMAILWALDLMKRQELSLYLTGFSFFEGRHYYFKDNLTRPPCHPLEREREMLRSRLADGLHTGRIRCDSPMEKILLQTAT